MLYRWIHKFEIKHGCWVYVPDRETILRGQKIKQKIESLWEAPANYTHLKQGGHIQALKNHVGNKLFIRTDIRQFFNQINRSRIVRSLTGLLSYKDALEIANESTIKLPDLKKSILPFGFVQSPILASLCLYKSALGSFLQEISGQGFTTTIYMDDILISTNKSYEQAEAILVQLKKKAERSRLFLNAEKTIGPSSEVTAFNINLSLGNMKVTDKRLHEFEEKLSVSLNSNEIEGVLGYIKTINVEQAHILSTEFVS